MKASDETAMVAALGPEFARFSEYVATQPDWTPSSEGLVVAAARAVPHASACAVTVARASARPQTLAASGDLPRTVDEIQYQTHEGPCLDALDNDDLILVGNLAADSRWPEFSRRCLAETPIRSMLSVRLKLDGHDRAALNFYADQPNRFADIDAGVASIFGAFVATTMRAELEHQRADNLEVALRSSRQIGTAMGILMARRLVTSDEAFELLRRASQHLNRKLRDVAAEVELTGTLPPTTRPRQSSSDRLESPRSSAERSVHPNPGQT